MLAYNSPQNIQGRSPLDIPSRTVLICFIAACLISLLAGNLLITQLYQQSKSHLQQDYIQLPVNANDPAKEKVKIIFPENARFNVALVPGLDSLFQGDRIYFVDFANYLVRQRDSLNADQVITDCLGKLTWFPLSQLSQENNFALMEKYGFCKPVGKQFKQLTGEEMNYQLGLYCMAEFRRKLSGVGDITNPHRALRLFAGLIQWATFIAFVWGMMLVSLRFAMMRIQHTLIISGKLPTMKEGEDIWTVNDADPSKELYFHQIEDKYPNLFLPVTIIHDVFKRSKFLDGIQKIDDFIAEQVNFLKAKVDSEYELLNFIVYVIPGLGFIGTVLGIIAAMDGAVLVLIEKEATGQAEAMTIVTNNLSVAFDTTFVALVLNIFIFYSIASIRKKEAALFETLATVSTRHLKDLWSTREPF